LEVVKQIEADSSAGAQRCSSFLTLRHSGNIGNLRAWGAFMQPTGSACHAALQPLDLLLNIVPRLLGLRACAQVPDGALDVVRLDRFVR